MPFTPVQTLIGAAMMGMAANNLLVLNGGVLGVSGFAHRSVASLKHSIQKSLRGISETASNKEVTDPGPDPEQLALLSMAGLLAGGLLVGLGHSSLEKETGAQLVDVYASSTPEWRKALGYALGGALVGLGSKLANGCTSGHMLCGVSRLSPRSLVATGVFVPIAVLTHLVLGCCAPFSIETGPERELGMPSWWAIMLLQIPILFYRYGSAFLKGFAGEKAAKKMVAFSTSLHFSLGLVLSGMLRPSKILNFFNLTPSAIKSGEWDPSLLLVIVGGIIPQLLAWQCCLGAYIRQPNTRPKFADTWSVPKVSLSSNWKESITPRLVFGAAIFGAGWGLCGICPGPAAIMIGVAAGGDWRVQVWRSAVWVPSFVVGGIVGGMI